MSTPSCAAIVPVVLCGGSGTRLWPASRELFPKPFIKLGNGESLFGATLARLKSLGSPLSPIIVTNENHRFYALESLNDAEVAGELILEPEPRNTAPAICLAALRLLERGEGERPMLVAPSDHYIDNPALFCETAKQAASAAKTGKIVTFGVKPDRADASLGYIRAGAPIDGGLREVAAFIEKPSLDRAEEFIRSGDYYWNSGIFLLTANVYLRELEKRAPEILRACESAWRARKVDGNFIRPEPKSFLASPEDSIDYAIMEKTNRAAMAPLPCAWSDLGSWEAFYLAGERDENGNVSAGDVVMEDARDSYIRAEKKLVAAIGINNLIVIENDDAVLVADKNRSKDVKRLVATLKRANRDECRIHNQVYRPWGSYERVAAGERFQVKRLVVKPGGSLSLQKHHHRAEHWIIVAGTAEITLGAETALFTENQSVYIPIGGEHRLRNPGRIPLTLIEVQTGSYLGEDDIVRREDAYGRE